jgi:S1-C subfamily serine protease
VRPALGIAALPQSVNEALKLPKGVGVAQVTSGGPAARAGMQPFKRGDEGGVVPGDVITAVDDQPVANLDDLLTQLEGHQPGDNVTLTLWRAGKSRKQSLTLATAQQ